MIRASVLAALAAASLAAGEARAAETCYADETGRIVKRRLPGAREVPCPAADEVTGRPVVQAPPAEAGTQPELPPGYVRGPPERISPVALPAAGDYVDAVPMPDRWRVVDMLGYEERLLDPYNRNVLKADRPVHGEWFFNLGVLSDGVYERRDVPTPVGGSTTGKPGELDVFGAADQWAFSENLAVEMVYYKGDTVFRPPDYEFRLTPVFNYNYAELEEVLGLDADPRDGRRRTDKHVGIQAAFVDKHLRNVSDRYDFDSLRIGIQPFSSDFRGFLFQDNQLGARLFGTRANNRYQYNLAWFRRLEKDTNSGLNDVEAPLRDDDVFVANLYAQDVPVKGFTSQATVIYNRNREDGEYYYNRNDFIERPASLGREVPREYDVVYVGYSGDGHFGRANVSGSVYYAFGEEEPGVFVDRKVDISAAFAAAELSLDYDWIRPRLSLLYASGDDDPYDDKSTGFDAIFENPQFAGADTSYWIRQAVPLIGGGRVALSGRNGVLNSLRSSKEEGQSNFANPGTMLAGLGADLDLLPTLRMSLNFNTLYFVDTATVEAVRNQADIDDHIGYDLSVALTWRPMMSQNVVLRASYATLLAGDGFKALFPDEDPGYFLLNVVLNY
jgi:hypothetical protein